MIMFGRLEREETGNQLDGVSYFNNHPFDLTIPAEQATGATVAKP
jgi:hypothetical protein